MERIPPEWSLAPGVEALVALCGVDKAATRVLMAKLGDISHFDSPAGGLSGAGAQWTQYRQSPASGQHYPNREWACPADSGGISLELSLSGASDEASKVQCPVHFT
jgi:hypothetical protein